MYGQQLWLLLFGRVDAICCLFIDSNFKYSFENATINLDRFTCKPKGLNRVAISPSHDLVEIITGSGQRERNACITASTP
mmetsp:Transcript_27662/g.39564  ORF Transcript_27662/g.39564 Transcript_27662/m.39564 type:complete len:80 (-) Transcript_27662:1023-1262(-)